MKRIRLSKLLMGVFIASSIGVYAQNYQTMPVQSGFTADVIANGVGTSASSTSIDVDGVSFAFVSKDFQLTSSSSALTYGLPINGLISSAVSSTPGLTYQMANYTGNNSLRLAAQNDTGTISFVTPKAATKLYMLATSGSGTSTVTLVINFTDGTSQTVTGVTIADWYGGSNYAIQGIGRINRTNDTLESGGGTNPRLYQTLVNIDAANQTKPIQSVAVTKTSTAQGYPNVFAFAIDEYSSCPTPTLSPVGTVTANSAAVSWTIPSGTSAQSYDIYYSTTNTMPATPNITGITGTSYTIPSLNSSTTYYYWVKSNCGAGSTASSFSGTFTTPCVAITALPWTENFDGLTTIGANVVPPCWSSVTGSKAWTSKNSASDSYNMPKSTPNYMAIAYSNINASVLWTPQFSLAAGTTYTFSFYYNTNGTSSSYIGYTGNVLVNSSQSATGATNLGTFITSTQGTTTYTLYTTIYTPTTSGNYAFGISVSSTSNPWYLGIDDVSLVSGSLGTSEVNASKNNVKVYPNPFTDVLNIADVSKVKSISIMDVSGKLVKTIDKPANALHLGDLTAGMYLVVLNMNDGSKQTIKAMKK